MVLLALTLLALRGEGALARDETLRIIAADQLVDYTFRIRGIDAATSVAFYLFEENFSSEGEYRDFIDDPRFGIPLDVKDGVAGYSERYSKEGIPEANNLYYLLIVDGGRMIGRTGESPDFTFVDLGPVDDPEEHIRHAYGMSATVDFTAGYVAPYHTGPDAVPEPTGGFLLLLGTAAALLRRKKIPNP